MRFKRENKRYIGRGRAQQSVAIGGPLGHERGPCRLHLIRTPYQKRPGYSYTTILHVTRALALELRVG